LIRLVAGADLDHPVVEVASATKRLASELLDEPPTTGAGVLEAFILRLDGAVLLGQQTLQFVNFLRRIIYYYRLFVKYYRINQKF